MIKILKNEKDVHYVIMNKGELKSFSLVENPRCDECFKELSDIEEIIYIPSLNEAYCKKCGMDKMNICSRYEDYDITYIENRIEQINEVFNILDCKKDILTMVREDNQIIENRYNINNEYNLLNKLYTSVPESYRDKIHYGDNEETGEEKVIFFDDIPIGQIDNINYIGCLDGRICGREDNETTDWDKHISIDCNGTYRNIFFRYEGNGSYKCEMTPKLEKGKIHKKTEMIEVKGGQI